MIHTQKLFLIMLTISNGSQVFKPGSMNIQHRHDHAHTRVLSCYIKYLFFKSPQLVNINIHYRHDRYTTCCFLLSFLFWFPQPLPSFPSHSYRSRKPAKRQFLRLKSATQFCKISIQFDLLLYHNQPFLTYNTCAADYF